MPTKSQRSKGKKFRKKPSGKSKRIYEKKKPGKNHCTTCGRVMHGTPHGKTKAQVAKLSKTKKRPTALFAGTLCNKCRAKVAEEAAKLEAGSKKPDEIELRFKKYVEQVKVE